MSLFQKVAKFLFIPLFLISLAACLPEDKKEKSEFVKVIISDRTFKIPRGYFDGRTPGGKDTESVVLEYSLPNFEVLPPQCGGYNAVCYWKQNEIDRQ